MKSKMRWHRSLAVIGVRMICCSRPMMSPRKSGIVVEHGGVTQRQTNPHNEAASIADSDISLACVLSNEGMILSPTPTI